MFIDVFFYLDAEKQIGRSWDADFPKYKMAILQGFVSSLEALEEQIKTACSRERFATDIGFDLDVFDSHTSVTIAAKPQMWGCFFTLNPKTKPIIRFELPTREQAKERYGYSEPTWDWIGNLLDDASRAARQFTADFARDGLPKEMKQAICAIGQVERLHSLTYIDNWKEFKSYEEVLYKFYFQK